MTVTVTVPDRLAEQAQAAGFTVEDYIEQILQREAEQELTAGESRQGVEEAVDHIRSSRKGVRLGGLRIKDLVHEGYKY